ncbi:MAG: 50S ribosomal protein L3 [Bryobacterales bacterium]|nr:50S ribosomal protein L3 [Bryobacterales bacterium]MDE0296198.1 50S ribosomal protein L3 [Bryobacterales bacterium]MDE0436541.1 50S ribosomal protein L3 [Bryobacterales bacterium]
MAPGILGKKIGMTQVFRDNGRIVPVTALQAGPCVVVSRKTSEKDGYEALQVGLVEFINENRVNLPMRGHFAKSNVAPCRFLRELLLEGSEEEEWKTGDRILAGDFSVAERVDVIGTSKGRGFAGTIKRHNFRRGPESHGSMSHRAPGSIGQSSYPSRVIKGLRMPGQMGKQRVTVKNLEIIEVQADENVLLVKGAVPGPNGGYIIVRRIAN